MQKPSMFVSSCCPRVACLFLLLFLFVLLVLKLIKAADTGPVKGFSGPGANQFTGPHLKWINYSMFINNILNIIVISFLLTVHNRMTTTTLMQPININIKAYKISAREDHVL